MWSSPSQSCIPSRPLIFFLWIFLMSNWTIGAKILIRGIWSWIFDLVLFSAFEDFVAFIWHLYVILASFKRYRLYPIQIILLLYLTSLVLTSNSILFFNLTQDSALMNSQGRSWTWQQRSSPRRRPSHTHVSLKCFLRFNSVLPRPLALSE